MNQLSYEYGTYEKQERLLAMMKDVDALLRANGIQYSLCGGSLLGAIRENGFIPWDDDIDIMVDRYNYQKLIEMFDSQDQSSPYRLNKYLWVDRIQKKDDDDSPLLSDTIDVFVMDHCPDQVIVRKLKLLLVMILQGMMKKKQDYSKYSAAMRICLRVTHILGLPFSEDKKFRWYQKIAMIGNRKPSMFITGYTDLFKCLRLRYSNKLFDRLEEHCFEDTKFMITAEYDNYLTTQYGDYMTPPKMEDRVPFHTL